MTLTIIRSTLAMSTCLGLTALAQTAVTEPSDTTPETAPKPSIPLLTTWNTSLYGFIEADFISDSTQSFDEQLSNTPIARPGTYNGDNRRLIFSIRHSRIGFRLGAPEFHGIRASALLEVDFLGNQPSNVTEAAFFTFPTPRVRLAYFKAQTDYVDVLIGQYWSLLNFETYFNPATVMAQPVPGELYNRTPQLRVSRLLKFEPVTVEVSVSIQRPPQMDSGWPDGQAGVQLIYHGWKGVRTNAATTTLATALSVAAAGTVRGFKLPELSATPRNSVTATSAGYSIYLMLPIIPAKPEERGNALTAHGSYAHGSGIADQFSSLTGGVVFPTLPGGATYDPHSDRGTAMFAANSTLHTVNWRAMLFGLEYYLPPEGRFWIAVNFSQLYSENAAKFGPPSSVFNHQIWADANLFVDVTPALRFGLEYAYERQTYVDGVRAANHRFVLGGFFIF